MTPAQKRAWLVTLAAVGACLAAAGLAIAMVVRAGWIVAVVPGP